METSSEAVSTVDGLCEVCEEGPRLYKCPRCSMFTCSLACCKKHKVQTQCNGIRDRAQFVACREFTETNLKSDYHFLEDVLQTKNRAKRTLAQNCGGEKKGHPAKKTKPEGEEIPLIVQDTVQRLDSYPKGIKALFNAAKERGTRLVLMPNGMTKRTLNRTSYNPKENTIFWKVFVVFVTGAGFITEALFRVDLESNRSGQALTFTQQALVGGALDGVSEKKTIDQIFEQFMKPTVENAPHRHALRGLRLNKTNVRCLMHRVPSPTSNPVFVEVDMLATLKDALSGQTIIEYPTLYFGTYEHTDRLSTLIAAADSAGTVNDSAVGGNQPIAVLGSGEVAEEGAEERGMQDSAMEVEGLQLGSPTKRSGSSSTIGHAVSSGGSGTSMVAAGQAVDGKVRNVSRDLLCLEYGSDDDEEPSAAPALPAAVGSVVQPSTSLAEVQSVLGGRFTSGNVGAIVGGMQQYIESTLAEVDAAEAQLSHAQSLFASQRSGGSSSSSRSGGGLTGAVPVSKGTVRFADHGDSDSDTDEAGMADSGVNGIEGMVKHLEATGEGNEGFLAALRDLADKDIDSLKAIIAAAEAEEGDENEEEDEDGEVSDSEASSDEEDCDRSDSSDSEDGAMDEDSS